jgi:hypothetical protein
MPAVMLPPPLPNDLSLADRFRELRGFVARVEQRVGQYLHFRTDNEEQTDHLRHVADRTRWMYYSELLRGNPGASIRISEHEDALIEACVFTHDIGKWIPRPELHALMPSDAATLNATFARLKFSTYQSDLLLLALRKRFALAQDGYTPEYDSAHHLVSAFLLASDERLGFSRLAEPDQARLITMIVGHQFGGYFKESLLNLSLRTDSEVTTGMLLDVSRPDRLQGDLLACAFHDADISDLLFVGSLEQRPNREAVFHAGGLVKILMINFTNCIYQAPSAPTTLEACLRSCQATVQNACKEFITPTAVEHGYRWRREAVRFLTQLREKAAYDKLNSALLEEGRPSLDRLGAVRVLARLQARDFLTRPDEPGAPGEAAP